MTASLAATGTFFYLKRENHGVAPPGLDWLPVTSLGIFIAAFALGTGPISYMVQGEILPPEAKGKDENVGFRRMQFKACKCYFCVFFFVIH